VIVPIFIGIVRYSSNIFFPICQRTWLMWKCGKCAKCENARTRHINVADVLISNQLALRQHQEL
jgi:hypothetical protein